MRKYLQSWKKDDFEHVFLYPAKLPFNYKDLGNFSQILSKGLRKKQNHRQEGQDWMVDQDICKIKSR